jgi:hypothetical protein
VLVLHAESTGVADIFGAARLVLSQQALDRLTAIAQAPERGGEGE